MAAAAPRPALPVTAAHKMKTAEKTHEIIRSILEVAPFGIYIVNQKGMVEYANSAMAAISNETHMQLLSINVFNLPEYKRLRLDEKVKAVFDGTPFSAGPVEYMAHFSKKITVRKFTGIPLEEKNEKKALIFVEDLTQIKKAEEEERKAIEAKSQFISMVSHELRTPLAVVKEYIDIVQDGTSGGLNAKQQEYLKIARDNVILLTKLVNDFLNYQKLDAGRMDFKMELLSVNGLVEEVARNMSHLAKEKGLEIKITEAKDIPEVVFDRDRIRQVLTNLMANAVKFTDKGEIVITTSSSPNAVCVSVTDTGIGIKKDDMSRLFRTFSQIGGACDSSRGGTGLGLAISRKIIQAHHGKIEAHSEYGEGSVFSFFLPVTERRR
jgi:PAS domain S-box-containing protein